MSDLNAPEPPPRPDSGTPIWPLVIADMEERDRIGRAKYGTPLCSGNGRDPLVDAYQESLDKTVYLRAAIEERRLLIERIRELDREYERDYQQCHERNAGIGAGYVIGERSAIARVLKLMGEST